jgi:hypothetical protein
MAYTNHMRDRTHVPGEPVSPVQFYNALLYFLGYFHHFLPALAALPAYPPPVRAGTYSPAFCEYPGTRSGGLLFQPFPKV